MLLKIENLNFSYGDVQVLEQVHLEVQRGDIVTLVGSNGAGKTTLLRNISGLVRPASGAVEYEGVNLLRLEPHEIVKLGLVHVAEGRRIFPEMTVLENLRLGSFTPKARKDRASNLEKVFHLFPRLKERIAQLGGTLSGGEQQMLAIGRGLMANPKLLLLDEPSLGLSPLFVKAIFDIIREINRQGVTILLVEQNVYQALRVARRAHVLETGRVILSGEAETLLADPQVKAAFLGA